MPRTLPQTWRVRDHAPRDGPDARAGAGTGGVMADDTPPRPYPAKGTIDAVFFHEFRREMVGALRDMRSESSNAFGQVSLRLTAIEGRLTDGQEEIAKHGFQIGELSRAATD